MAETIHSTSWYRVADLRPAIRRHVHFDRHDYRGQIWYVLRDPSNERSFRFTPAANYVVGLLDGERTLQEVWQLTEQHFGDEAPTQDEMVRLLGQLHAADVLVSDVLPDIDEAQRRGKRYRGMKWRQRWSNPLAIRIPVVDPDRFLNVTLPLVRPLFSRLGFLLWLVIVAAGGVLAVMHWNELTANIVDRVFAVENLIILWLAYPVVKLFHELGHGYATKVWGGEVHELGIMLLVLAPVPYVEASSASAFREKHKRMVVGAIGIMIELFLATLALMVWLAAEPGVVRTFAFNVALIGGISTLLFNGNPLLRFDGYYVLADAIEIPNLATRANRYLGYLVQRFLFRAKQVQSPVTAPGEPAWFVFYGIASFLYRMFLVVVIVLLVAGQYFFIGVLLAIWAVARMVVYPALKTFWFVFNNPVLDRVRTRSVFVTLTLLSMAFAAFLYLPLPHATRAEGVVWMPKHSIVRSETEGFITDVLAGHQSRVSQGQTLIRSAEKLEEARADLMRARLEELRANYLQYEFSNPTKADVVRQEIDSVRRDYRRTQARLRALSIKSPTDGVLILPNETDLEGRFLNRGELIGYVLTPETISVRVVVDQNQIGLVRERTQDVEVWLADWAASPMPATISRFVPGAAETLPTAVLSTDGGGRYLLDPREPQSLRTLEPTFQLDLTVPQFNGMERIGTRVHVRFDHGEEPLAAQLYRHLRQLFLSQYGV